MTTQTEDPIGNWKAIPGDIERLLAGISDEDLASMPGSEGMTLKEVVHHIVEANIVAASMIIAALGASGPTYDWSWLWPNREWTDRLGYNKVPVEPSLRTLSDLIEHISNLISLNDDTLERVIRLFDTPGGETYTKTVGEIIKMEIDHAKQRLDDVRANLKQ
jgi:hypothetical protein